MNLLRGLTAALWIYAIGAGLYHWGFRNGVKGEIEQRQAMAGMLKQCQTVVMNGVVNE
jgi:disulfide bond formation protein DsbB